MPLEVAPGVLKISGFAKIMKICFNLWFINLKIVDS